jgi:hypothetical protein
MECSKLGGQWKERDKFPMFEGQWKEKEKLPILGGQWNEKEKFLLFLFPFPPPSNLLRPSFFSFDLMVLLYHSFKLLFMHSLLFSLAYKLQSCLSMSQVPHTFIVDSVW